MAARRMITAIVWPPGLGARAQLDCGHLANILARSPETLQRRVGTERVCSECPVPETTCGVCKRPMSCRMGDLRFCDRCCPSPHDHGAAVVR